jgi:hypothetical protein
MIKNIGVKNTVNSYIKIGAEGNFHLAKMNKTYSILFAYDNEERKVYDGQEMEDLRTSGKIVGIFAIVMLPVAVLFIAFFGLGLIATPACIYIAYISLVRPLKIKDKTLRSYLVPLGYK